MLALMAEREQTRGFQAAKLRRIRLISVPPSLNRVKATKLVSGGKKHRRAGECQGAKKNEEKDTKKRKPRDDFRFLVLSLKQIREPSRDLFSPSTANIVHYLVGRAVVFPCAYESVGPARLGLCLLRWYKTLHIRQNLGQQRLVVGYLTHGAVYLRIQL